MCTFLQAVRKGEKPKKDVVEHHSTYQESDLKTTSRLWIESMKQFSDHKDIFLKVNYNFCAVIKQALEGSQGG